MVFHVEYERTVAAQKPDGHRPAAPRHSLRWNKPVSAIVADYFALQGANLSWDEQRSFFDRATSAFEDVDGPDSHETMRSRDEHGFTNAIVVAYWTDPLRHARWSLASLLSRWFNDPARLADPAGIWRETTTVPYDRHETIYSENWYRVGIGRTANSVIVPITTNGYFGAARDRLPISAIDRLESPHGEQAPDARSEPPKGQRVRVTAPLNMVTLRSGQFWAHAEGEQLDDYVDNLQPRLMTGMDYLVAHKPETGTLALNTMTNLDRDGNPLRETSVYAHFLSLTHLEKWAASHETHLAIYRHAIAMNRKYAQQRQFVSWHELFVHQTATFEYVNCHPNTGLLPYFEPCIIDRLDC